MNNIEKVKRQLAKPISIKLTNDEGEEDEFMFKRLNVGQQAMLMEVGKRIQSRKMIELDGVQIPDLEKEDMVDMGELILDVVNSSIPGLAEEDAKDFASNHFNELSDALSKLMPQEKGNLSLMKKKLEESRNGGK